eukprot:36187-Chlamydomonas_euryale.AAC.1
MAFTAVLNIPSIAGRRSVTLAVTPAFTLALFHVPLALPLGATPAHLVVKAGGGRVSEFPLPPPRPRRPDLRRFTLPASARVLARLPLLRLGHRHSPAHRRSPAGPAPAASAGRGRSCRIRIQAPCTTARCSPANSIIKVRGGPAVKKISPRHRPTPAPPPFPGRRRPFRDGRSFHVPHCFPRHRFALAEACHAAHALQ